MTSRNAVTPAPAGTGNGRRKSDQLGQAIGSTNSKPRQGRQAQRAAASIYSGRTRLGAVEPHRDGYFALDADGAPLGQFSTFNEAASAVTRAGNGDD